MKSEFLLAFNQICSERNLPKEVVLEALNTALVSAYRRDVNASSAQNITAVIDGQTGLAHIYAEKEVTDQVTDWSGKISVTGESIVRIACKISFEPGQDSVLPQVNRNEVDWVSAAGSDFDGLSFMVVVNNQTATPIPVQLTFGTTPITIVLGPDKLSNYTAYYPVDSTSGVAVHSQRLKFRG